MTFDHLSRCPKCQASFRLARRLTRRPDPQRRIVLPGAPDRDGDETADASSDEAGAAAPPVAGTPPAPRPAPPDDATTVPDGADASSPMPDAPPERRPVAEDELTPAPAGAAFRPAADRASTATEEPPGPQAEPAAPAATPSRYPRRGSAAEHDEDRRRMKERMVAAGRERRRERAEAAAGGVDPLLPGWYVPATDDNDAQSEPATGSSDE